MHPNNCDTQFLNEGHANTRVFAFLFLLRCTAFLSFCSNAEKTATNPPGESDMERVLELPSSGKAARIGYLGPLHAASAPAVATAG